MNGLTLADIPGPAEAAAARPALEQEVIGARRLRRLALGPHMTLLFENRLTCLWQVLEMVRLEQLRDPAAIQHELDTYNALLPGPMELSVTLLIEVEDPEERAVLLRRLVGLHQALSLRIGDHDPIPFSFDEDQFNKDRISSVQFLRLPLDDVTRVDLGNLARSAVVTCAHPAYSVEAVLPPTLRAALVEDLIEATARKKA